MRLPLADRVIPPKAKDRFGAIEMKGLYGLHLPRVYDDEDDTVTRWRFVRSATIAVTTAIP